MKTIQMELERARYGNGGLIQTHWSGSEFKPKKNITNANVEHKRNGTNKTYKKKRMMERGKYNERNIRKMEWAE